MKIKLSALVLVAAWLLAGCNTMAGIGKDIQKGGEVLEDAAKKK